jgi:vacuolar-type H+-ATPase subunit H
MVGILVLGLAASVCAQQSSSAKLSTEACSGVQKYVAKIDATRGMAGKAQRQEAYAQAQKDLEPILQQIKQPAMTEAASQYAKLSEEIVAADSTTPNLPDLLDKRLKARGILLDHCDD